jgi:hypothetical protein
MVLGPMELVVRCYPAAQLNDGVQATLDRLGAVGDMRIVDILVVRTDAAGGACAVELNELPGLRIDPDTLVRLRAGLITETDIDDVADLVDHGTDAVVVLMEYVRAPDPAGQRVEGHSPGMTRPVLRMATVDE